MLLRMVVRVRVFVRVLGIEGGNGHHQAAVLNALEPDKKIGETLDAGSLAVNNQHFQAGIEVQMRVTRRNNQVVVFVLHFRELLGDPMGMMVENQGHGADDGGLGRGGPLSHQPVPDQVPKSLGTIRVSALFNGEVEPLQEFRIESDADSV